MHYDILHAPTQGAGGCIVKMIVVRGNHILARPLGARDGSLPEPAELHESMTFINSIPVGDGEFEALAHVSTDSLGDAPEGYRWLTPVALQEEAPEFADLLGEALLCV